MGFISREFGDSAVLLTFSDAINKRTHLEIVSFVKALKKKKINGIKGIVSAYTTVTVQYDFLVVSYSDLLNHLVNINFKADEEPNKKVVEIPVCYDAMFALDMEYLCSYSGLSKEEVIKRHTSQEYLVHMIGFTPGFFYLSGLDIKLFCPRKETPRIKIESGSIGIAGYQTGMYSIDSPGGWQLIGKSPMLLFDKKNKESYFKLRHGDFVRFIAISLDEFKSYEK